MEIKIDIIGDDVELTAFLHNLMINHSPKEETAVKTQNAKKLGRPKKTGRPKKAPDPVPRPEQQDDDPDEREIDEIREKIFGNE